MAYDYTSLRGRVDLLVARFGAAAAIRTASRSGDAWSPTVATSDTDCFVLFDDSTDSDRDGSLVTERVRKVYINAGNVTVSNGDKLVLGGDVYALDSVTQIAPGGVNLLYRATARI